MNRMIITTLAALIAGHLATASALAETQPGPPALAPSSPTGMAAIAKQLGTEALSLKEQTARALTKLDELERTMQREQKNTEGAATTVKELLALLRDAARRLDNDGAYAKALNAEQATVTDLADQARTHPDTEVRKLADWYTGKADEIAGIRRDAEQLRTQLLAQIDRLEQEKERLRFAIAATHIEAFIKDARGYLDILSHIATGAKGLADGIGNAFGTNRPTQ